MLFCYHPDIVVVWKNLPGAPRNIRVPNRKWTFANKERKGATNNNDRKTSEEKHLPLTHFQNRRLKPNVSWADACDSDCDEEMWYEDC